MIMESQRQKKVSRLIQKDLSAIFLQESKSQFFGVMISITHVFVSKDLSLAKVYLSIFPDNKKSDLFEDITLKTKHFKHKLAFRLKDQMRKTPDLVFYLDNSLDHYESINKILKDI